MDIRSYLDQLGLDDKEIATYLACLELGESSIMPIVKKTDLPKTTVYHLLDRLKEHGLIEIMIRGTKYYYVPYPPKKLLTLYRHKITEAKERAENLAEALPEIDRLYVGSAFQPKVRYFKGQKELREIYDEVLDMPIDEEWYVGETNKLVKALGESYLKKWVHKRVAKNIKSKSIRVASEESKQPEFLSEKLMRSIRYAPESFKSPTHIMIYGDNVAIITTGEEDFGLVVTSREFAETMRHWFKELWKVSK